jgi:protein-S-isoprenylcysteine O-methyltransferase Ste14
MSKALNKTRVRDSRIAAGLAILVYLFSRGLFPDGTAVHELNEFVGYFLVLLCAFGRIFSTAFIGGRKNETLVMDGPFSISRNPLYLFSLIGILGVGLMSNRISVLAVLLVYHLIAYHFLVRREEAMLAERFGEVYRDYRARVPRLWPRLSLYRSPEMIELRPKFLANAMRDASVWFLVYPLFELIDYLHNTGLLPTLYFLP